MAAVAQQEGFRALQLFDHIPAGHRGVLVTGHDFEPHLRRGEFAIADEGDKSIQFGELYVITIAEPSGPPSLAIVQLVREVTCVGGVLGLMYGFGLPGTGSVVFKGERLRYVDGPWPSDLWPGKSLGRIVDFLKPSWQRP